MHSILPDSQLLEFEVTCPLRDSTSTHSRFMLHQSDTAYMEVANSSGLQMVPKERRSPWNATSVVGLLSGYENLDVGDWTGNAGVYRERGQEDCYRVWWLGIL